MNQGKRPGRSSWRKGLTSSTGASLNSAGAWVRSCSVASSGEWTLAPRTTFSFPVAFDQHGRFAVRMFVKVFPGPRDRGAASFGMFPRRQCPGAMKMATHEGRGSASSRAATRAPTLKVRLSGIDGTLRAWCINSMTTLRAGESRRRVPFGSSAMIVTLGKSG